MGPSAAETTRIAPSIWAGAGDHVLECSRVSRAVHVRVVTVLRLVLDVGDGMVMPLAFSSGALSIWSNGVKSAMPFVDSTLVMAAVRVVLPWSM